MAMLFYDICFATSFAKGREQSKHSLRSIVETVRHLLRGVDETAQRVLCPFGSLEYTCLDSLLVTACINFSLIVH